MTTSALDPFFSPRSVAVVGASRTKGKAGYHQIENLKRTFLGSIYPVNPKAKQLLGLPCFTSIHECPGFVDLAIILLRDTMVPEAVSACVDQRIPAVLIPSSGFAEASSDGERLQSKLLKIVSGTNTRIWGPNCGGLVNTENGLTAAFIDLPMLRQGPIGIISQTGLYTAALMNQMMENEDFGVSKIATLGNACDINEIDVLEYFANDPTIHVIAMHIEGISDGSLLLNRGRELTLKKPIIAVIAGQTEAGAKAGASHTARLAADTRMVESIFAQSGIIPAFEYLDLMELSRAFVAWKGPVPAKKIAILSTSGGAGVLVADMIAQAGLEVAEFSSDTIGQLSALHPYSYGVGNPFDLWPAMERVGTDQAVKEIAKIVFDDPGVDAAMLVFGAFSGGGSDLDPDVMGDLAKRHGKIAACWLYGPTVMTRPWIKKFSDVQIPCFHDLKMAVRALKASHALSKYRTKPAAVPSKRSPEAEIISAAIIASVRKRQDRSLNQIEGRDLLEAWGLRSAQQIFVEDVFGAMDAADTIGYPVALKIESPDIQHKVDIGGVVLNLRDRDELAAGYENMMRKIDNKVPNARIDGVLLQEMIPDGREIVVGATQIPQFGMVMMLGLGGTYVEDFGKVVFRLPPLEPRDIDQMIDESGIGTILSGKRGRQEADRSALELTITCLSNLVQTLPQIEQIEINPLLVLDSGQGVVAVDSLVILRD